MKSVMISIQPKWCELSASGKKTVEVRKTRPKIDTPFKVYIYCTNNKRQYLRKLGTSCKEIFITENRDVIGRTEKVNSLIGDTTTFWENGGYNGKVIGEFVCDRIEDMRDVEQEPTCLTIGEWLKYTDGHKGKVWGWHISNLVIYDKPKELGEFVVEGDCSCEDCSKCKWFEKGNGYNVEDDCRLPYAYNFKTVKPLKRPPQSWCYVEGAETDEG